MITKSKQLGDSIREWGNFSHHIIVSDKFHPCDLGIMFSYQDVQNKVLAEVRRCLDRGVSQAMFPGFSF